MRPAARALLWLAAAAALLATFSLYTRGSFVRDVADLLWSCF